MRGSEPRGKIPLIQKLDFGRAAIHQGDMKRKVEIFQGGMPKHSVAVDQTLEVESNTPAVDPISSDGDSIGEEAEKPLGIID